MGKWIQSAIKRPGQLHRDLGVPQGKPIPKSMIAAAAKRGGKVGQRARLAQTLSHMQRKSTKGSPEATNAEMAQGYKSLGSALKQEPKDNRGEGV